MRIAYLAAGAGGMFCGSCLRDNRVVSRLRADGRDVVLIPLYTPLRTDEHDVSQRRVYYGGINVYLEQKSRLFRMLPRAVTRVLDAPALLRRAMGLAGDPPPEVLGAMTVSILQGEHGRQRRELEDLLDALRAIQPAVVVLPNLMFVGLARRLRAELGAVIVCTLSGEDIFLDSLPESHRREAFSLIRDRASDVDAHVAVTNYFAQHAVRHFGLPVDRIHVVPMGLDVLEVGEDANPPDDPFTIGYLARICPEKGLANLCDALSVLRRAGRTCRLRVAGYLGRKDRTYLERLRAQLKGEGMASAFEYVGEVDLRGKYDFLRSLHVLSVPTDYPEAKGLYVLEALACGVPVVQPRHGSFPELVEATGGGVLYDPTSPDALADAIASLMDDSDRRRQLGSSGRRAVHASFTDTIMATRTWELCERLVEAQSPSSRISGEPC